MTHRVAPVEESDWRRTEPSGCAHSRGRQLLRQHARAGGGVPGDGVARTRPRDRHDATGHGMARRCPDRHRGGVDEGDSTVQVVSVWVDPSHRGRGVAATSRPPRWTLPGGTGFPSRGSGSPTAIPPRAGLRGFGFTPTGKHEALHPTLHSRSTRWSSIFAPARELTPPGAPRGTARGRTEPPCTGACADRRPPMVVFEHIADGARNPQWRPTVVEVTLHSGDGRAGTVRPRWFADRPARRPTRTTRSRATSHPPCMQSR